ncbi:MAG: hypothetical protein ACLTCB_04605 [Merdibacter sp.]
MLEAEGAVEGEYAGAVSGVEVGQRVIHLFRALAVLQLVHHLQHHLADAAVVHALALGDGVIVGDQREAVEIQPFFETAEVIVEQFPKHLQILQDEQIDRPLRSRLLLADQREGILVGHEQPGQITVPQIAVESAFGRQIEQRLDLGVDPVDQFVFRCASFIELANDAAQLTEDAVSGEPAVDDETGVFLIHR